MNREIKFRAWIRCGEWDEESDKQKFIMIDGDSLAFEEYLPLCDLLKDKEDEVYLMQFTGLKDKKGVEIYEGDIIHVYGENRLVEFKNAFWQLTIPENNVLGGFGTETESGHKPLYRYAEPEVIGNIYENPNLIP